MCLSTGSIDRSIPNPHHLTPLGVTNHIPSFSELIAMPQHNRRGATTYKRLRPRQRARYLPHQQSPSLPMPSLSQSVVPYHPRLISSPPTRPWRATSGIRSSLPQHWNRSPLWRAPTYTARRARLAKSNGVWSAAHSSELTTPSGTSSAGSPKYFITKRQPSA